MRAQVAPTVEAAATAESAAPAAEDSATAAPVATDPAAALLAHYAALTAKVARSPFEEPLHIESTEAARRAEGDVYGIVEHPIAVVAAAISSPARWCDILILHQNVKQCRAGEAQSGDRLSVAIGRKRDRALSSASRIEFIYRIAAAQPDYVAVVLEAERGPFGTRNYLVAVEAVRLDDAHSVVHLRYALQYGVGARFAMGLYLATEGSSKVGFTAVGDDHDGQPKLVSGTRGAIERNVMRYYLAVDAYLDVQDLPETERFEASLDRWFSATERYARQLHELDRDQYLALKRRDHLR